MKPVCTSRPDPTLIILTWLRAGWGIGWDITHKFGCWDMLFQCSPPFIKPTLKGEQNHDEPHWNYWSRIRYGQRLSAPSTGFRKRALMNGSNPETVNFWKNKTFAGTPSQVAGSALFKYFWNVIEVDIEVIEVSLKFHWSNIGSSLSQHCKSFNAFPTHKHLR